MTSGNVSLYPSVCAETTASFSVLSESIIAVRQILDDDAHHNRKDLVKLLTRLQQNEKQKLNLTAALHMEKIRAQSQQQLDEQQERDENGPLDTRIASLLQEGVRSLQHKIALTVEQINGTLEELRFALVEEGENE